ncbi:MAG: NUDIX domain-containing protein [Bacteroidota bacterium]
MLYHYTAGGVIVRKEQKQYWYLAILKQHGNSQEWTLPKGHIEVGESAREAAIREIREETGLFDLKYIGRLGKHVFSYSEQNNDHTKYVDWYLFETNNSQIIPSKEENILAGKWVTYQQAKSLITYANMLPFLQHAYEMLVEEDK